MNWFSFFGHEYIYFNAIVIRSSTFDPLKAFQSSAPGPRCNYDHFAIAFSFINFNLLPPNGH